MNILIILIIIFLCVYLISKFFNFDEIKKQIFALFTLFTLTNSTYPIKHGGANENEPGEGNDYKTKLELYKNPTVPYIYPYIFDEDIIIDGYNIFVTMKTKFEPQFRADYNEIHLENARNGRNSLEFNKYCLNRILNELSRCCKGKIHLIIKTGQDNTLGDIVYKHQDTIDAGIGGSVIVYDACYEKTPNLIQTIRILSNIENPSKEQKTELHRLKSLDDHLLMMIANKYPSAKIISFDKYKEIRFDGELPETYKYYMQSSINVEESVIDPRLYSDMLNTNIFINAKNPFYTRVMFPLFNDNGNIIMFGKYTNRALDFSYGQELFKETINDYMQNLHKIYIQLLDNKHSRNETQNGNIQHNFNREFEAKNAQLNRLNFNRIAIYNREHFHQPLHLKANTCITRMHNLAERFGQLYILYNYYDTIPGYFYDILPNAQEIYNKHYPPVDIDSTAVDFGSMRRL